MAIWCRAIEPGGIYRRSRRKPLGRSNGCCASAASALSAFTATIRKPLLLCRLSANRCNKRDTLFSHSHDKGVAGGEWRAIKLRGNFLAEPELAPANGLLLSHSMSLQILHPGTFSLLVDAGRPGSRSLGIPVGGRADRAAYRIGNALVGNRDDAVALEISFSGPALVGRARYFSLPVRRIPLPSRLMAEQLMRAGFSNSGR